MLPILLLFKAFPIYSSDFDKIIFQKGYLRSLVLRLRSLQPYVPLRTQLSESGPGRKTILSNLERPPNQACEQ